MDKVKQTAALTNYFFCILLCAGAVLLIASFFMTNDQNFFSGVRQIAVGLLCIGVGEWINHPLQKSLAITQRGNFIFKKFLHRKRKPSSLGNLFEIGGLILLFTGLSDYI